MNFLLKHRTLFTSLLFGLFFLCFSCNNYKSKEVKGSITEDNVQFFIDSAQNDLIGFENRKEYLQTAYKQNSTQVNDSLKQKALLKIAYESYKQFDTTFFRKVNKEANLLSVKINDTFGLGDTHWNYGNFYLKKEKIDSAYYHYYRAYQFFESINHEYYSAKMLYNMAVVQIQIKDYTGSEILTFKAIDKFKKTNKNKNLYSCNNSLGVIFSNLKEYDKAIYYHLKSLEYINNVPNNKSFIEESLNNLGIVYQKKGNYQKSIEYFDKVLKNKELKKVDPHHYARIIDNKTYTRFLKGDTLNILKDFNTALLIRDSVKSTSGIIVSKLHLAEFYFFKKNIQKAIFFANEVNQLSEQIKDNDSKLKSLKLLSLYDKVNASSYFEKFFILSEELQIKERKLRDKFTRIRFETDEYIEETEKLSRENLLISIVSVIGVLFLGLVFYLFWQNSKNKELLFEQEQQKTNEEIYSLLLKQQLKIQEGQLKERQRISEELHDGVLGKMFGARLGLGFLNIHGDTDTLNKHKTFVGELQSIEKEIRNISHDLKSELFSSELNFIVLVRNLLDKQSEIGGFKYELKNSNTINWSKVEESVKINCYRIIQEAIQNINKYAKASYVQIKFNSISEKLILVIDDDGVGFNTNKSKSGIGLKNITSRIDRMNGEFELASKIGEGTTLVIFIPL